MHRQSSHAHSAAAYPARQEGRNIWIQKLRPARSPVDPFRPNGFFIEQECSPSGALVDSLCVFLTNRECPWKCVMCDLWRHTTAEPTPPGAIPAQIDHTLAELARTDPGAANASQIKLYNSGSFFDGAAIPTADHPAIAQRLQRFERVIVECHPALVQERILSFRDLVPGQLEVAIGLETIHPEVLPKLNKGMTLDQFRRAAEFLNRHQIDLRVFILIQPPWLTQSTGAIEWAVRSAAFAFDFQATAVSLIPTRPGNGALDALAQAELFVPPNLATIETALDKSLALGRGRVFVDLWELERFASCQACFPARRNRLLEFNLRQQSRPRIQGVCEESSGVKCGSEG